MTLWQKVLALMDAVSESERRLAFQDAWNPYLGCGCLFGTLYPNTPRNAPRSIVMDFAENFYSKSHPAPWMRGFRDWAESQGLDRATVATLQSVNDSSPLGMGDAGRTARWTYVRRYVELREEGLDHATARERAKEGL